MIGDVRTLELTSAALAAWTRAALRLKRRTSRLWTSAQARLNLAAAAPRSSLVGASVIPTVRYRDVPKAVVWLCRAFGMKVHRVVTDADGAARYAELTVGAGMLMVAPIEDTAFGRMMVQPDEIGGVETQVCYLCVADARAHAARARSAGAVIIIDPDDDANKGRGYSCRDLEGHVWNFGVYDPWTKPPAMPAAPGWGVGRVQQALVVLVLLAVAGTLALDGWPHPGAGSGATVTAAQALAPPAEGGEKEDAKAGLKTDALPEKAVRIVPVSTKADDDAPVGGAKASTTDAADTDAAPVDRTALEAAEKAAADARALLATTKGALAKAEREATSARAELEEMQRAKLTAERAAAAARAKLAMLQKSADDARAEAAEDRIRRLATTRAAPKARRRVHVVRPRPGSWCYSPNGLLTPAKRGSRLSGFCKG